MKPPIQIQLTVGRAWRWPANKEEGTATRHGEFKSDQSIIQFILLLFRLEDQGQGEWGLDSFLSGKEGQ